MTIVYRGTDPAGDLTNTEMDSNFQTCQQRWSGSSVASASEFPLVANYNYFTVSGTTTINSMPDVHVGHMVTLKFDAALILTHSSVLIMPGAVS